MGNVLEKIIEDKRVEVDARKAQFPLSQFKADLVPSTKSLFGNLSQPNAGFIFECKKASPSKGLIRPNFDLDEILEAYTPFAAGISVLTDEKYFQGTYEYLAYVTERVAQPVLNKDFFIDTYQVYLARHYNADAVLLMLSVLSDDEYRELAAVANALSLDILTEVSNEEEMHRAIDLKANIIGINNRNLRDLSTDLAATERLVPMLENASHDFVVISESGIYTYQDVQRLAPLCQGFLVGSSLMAEHNVKTAVKTLLFGQTKVCGLTDVKQATHAFEQGAIYGGLIFAEKSPRYVTDEQAKDIVSHVEGDFVGVFVNSDIETIVEKVNDLSLRAVQLHGNETSSFRQALKDALPNDVAIWQALGVTDTIPSSLQTLLAEPEVSKVLLDCKVGNQSGGTGQQFNWALLDDIEDKTRLALAGGIGPDNIQAAYQTGVPLIDVNSGVEDAPGQKSVDKINALFSVRRQY